MKVRQVWRCEHCGWEYHAPIAVYEAICPNVHTVGRRRGQFAAELVQGEPPRPRRVAAKGR